jgi:NAD(P)-dependent dehydrogenase (short-subunit alcohol dehydrogenase family)
MGFGEMADAVIEAPVVTSFTRVGYEARSRLAHWRPLSSYDMSSRVVLVTGATSGLGHVAAEQFARLGAKVILLGRDPAKTEGVRAELSARTGNDELHTVVADMGDLAAVRQAGADVLARFDRLDVVVHNAGALTADRRTNSDGVEQTVASQVIGPFLLTSLLLDRLRGARPGRVITVSSGGMYASPLRVEDLQMGDDYRGAEQYARAKRAQVTFNEMWAERVPREEVVFHAMHPGWADTPGVRESLPRFRRIVGPLLRTPAQGADTIVWLSADDGEPLAASGGFWLDRRRRSIHKLPATRRSDTTKRRERLWSGVESSAGVTVSSGGTRSGGASGR